jgi:hypothetical protein
MAAAPTRSQVSLSQAALHALEDCHLLLNGCAFVINNSRSSDTQAVFENYTMLQPIIQGVGVHMKRAFQRSPLTQHIYADWNRFQEMFEKEYLVFFRNKFNLPAQQIEIPSSRVEVATRHVAIAFDRFRLGLLDFGVEHDPTKYKPLCDSVQIPPIPGLSPNPQLVPPSPQLVPPDPLLYLFSPSLLAPAAAAAAALIEQPFLGAPPALVHTAPSPAAAASAGSSGAAAAIRPLKRGRPGPQDRQQRVSQRAGHASLVEISGSSMQQALAGAASAGASQPPPPLSLEPVPVFISPAPPAETNPGSKRPAPE